jgi:hypothetical protein
MARKVDKSEDDVVVVGNQDDQLEEIHGRPDEVVVVGEVRPLQDNIQAQISQAGDDSIPAHVVEAANKGRLARGEDPVVPSNVATKQDIFSREANDAVFGELDGVGEDTQAVKQSQVPRLRDGKRISADRVFRENQDS